MKKVLVAASLLAAFGAQAQSTGSVNVIAGLSPVLKLTCSDVNFGVWRVPTGDRSGVTTVTLRVNGDLQGAATTPELGGTQINVSLATGYQVPTAGYCKLEGSNGYLGSKAMASISGATDMAFTTSSHDNLKVPVTAAGVKANLSLSTTEPVVTDLGEAHFRVVGVMTIPNNLVRANYGGYAAVTPATVSVSDAPVAP